MSKEITSVENKYQTSQDISTKQASDTDVKKDDVKTDDYLAKKDSDMGSCLKQETVAKVARGVGGGSVSGGMMIDFGGNTVSGAGSTVLAGREGTPRGVNTREQSRFGKKIEKVANKIDYTPSEQYIKAYREVTPLSAGGDKVQGYNGSYLNEGYKIQKSSGTTPAELTFDRSLDIIEKDGFYFTEGQQLMTSNADSGDKFPSKTWVADGTGTTGSYQPVDGKMYRKNYLHKNLKITLPESGSDVTQDLTKFMFEVEDITPTFSQAAAEKSNANAKVFDNRIELVREEIESKTGNEASDIWSPLGRAIEEPNETLALIHDVESVTGAEVFTAMSKLQSALSFQINRGTKDGMELQGPGNEMLIGGIVDLATSDAYLTIDGEPVSVNALVQRYNQNHPLAPWYNKGIIAPFVALYDSPNKYHTKADLLLQPRSFKMHLNTALANSKPLRVNAKFVKAFKENEVFSTFSGAYDPTLPILMTDKAGLVHPINLNGIGCFDYTTGGVNVGEDVLQYSGEDKVTVDAIKEFIGYEGLTKQYDRAVIAENGGLIFTNETGRDVWVYYKAGGENDTTAAAEWETKTPDNDLVLLTKTTAYDVAGLNIKTSGKKETITGYTRIGKLKDGASFYVGAILDEDALPSLIAAFNNTTGEKVDKYAYSYNENNNNVYISYVVNPLIEGLKAYFRSILGQLIDVFGAGTEITIPCIHSTRTPSLWDLVLCAATPYIVNERVKYSRDLLHLTDNIGYPFPDLIDVQEAMNTPYQCFSVGSADEPIRIGALTELQKVRWAMPEFFWTMYQTAEDENVKDDDENIIKVVAPWYVNEKDYKNSSGDIYLNEGEANFSWPSLRAGIKMDNLDMLSLLDDRQLRINLDIITDIATEFGHPDYYGIYKYGLSTDGQPIFAIDEDDFTIKKLLKLPRQLGFYMEAPAGSLTPQMDFTLNENTYYDVNLNATANMKTSFRAYSYMNKAAQPKEDILQRDTINITRAANFIQKWVKYEATKNENHLITDDYGILVGMGRGFEDGSLVEGVTVMSPISNTSSSGMIDNPITISSAFRAFHDRVQIMPFIISPFDQVNVATGRPSGWDIYDLCYIFGLCGFRASDYTEDVYNREVEIINKGLMYINDVWESESYLKAGY